MIFTGTAGICPKAGTQLLYQGYHEPTVPHSFRALCEMNGVPHLIPHGIWKRVVSSPSNASPATGQRSHQTPSRSQATNAALQGSQLTGDERSQKRRGQ